MNKDRSKHYAFARGYFDGRENGNEANPYDQDEQPELRQLYTDGYEWGVSDYCHELEKETEA